MFRRQANGRLYHKQRPKDSAFPRRLEWRPWLESFLFAVALAVGLTTERLPVMLAVFHAGEALFHTGWFIESMATQVLVIFIIRTRRNPFRSRPNPWLVACSLTVVAAAVLLPFTPFGGRRDEEVVLPPSETAS
ncbi:MAG TPA: cation transporting ATPase C-terminal domain-containing protein [Geobacteraceae bacterium]